MRKSKCLHVIPQSLWWTLFWVWMVLVFFFFGFSSKGEEGGGEKAQVRSQGFQLIAVSGESFCTSVLLGTLSLVGRELWRGKGETVLAVSLQCDLLLSGIASALQGFTLSSWRVIPWVVLTFQNRLCHSKVTLVAEFCRHGSCSLLCLAPAEACKEAGVVQIPLGGNTSLSVWPELSETLKTPCWQTKLAKNVASWNSCQLHGEADGKMSLLGLTAVVLEPKTHNRTQNSWV